MKAQKYMKQKVLNPRIKTFCWFSIFRTELRSYCRGSRKPPEDKASRSELAQQEHRDLPEGPSQFMFQLGKLRHREVWNLPTVTVLCGPRPRLRSVDSQASTFPPWEFLKTQWGSNIIFKTLSHFHFSIFILHQYCTTLSEILGINGWNLAWVVFPLGIKYFRKKKRANLRIRHKIGICECL